MKLKASLVVFCIVIIYCFQFSSCGKKKREGTVNFLFGDTVVLPQFKIPGSPLLTGFYFSDNVFTSRLQNTILKDVATKGVEAAWINSIKCESMGINVESPSNQSLDFTDSLVFYVANIDGSNKSLLGWGKIPVGAKSVNLTTAQTELKPYLIKDSLQLIIGGNIDLVKGINIPQTTVLKFNGKYIGYYKEL